MIKYILAGGYPHKAKDGGKAFFMSLIENKPGPVKLLECLFSRPRENWEKSFLQDKNYMETNITETKIDMKCATEENFIEELKWADAIYFRGGETKLLLERLLKHKGWEKLLEGKNIAGSSAGAYMLSKYYYDIESLCIKEGLGLTDTKVIVHFQSPNYKVEWKKALTELKKYKEDLPIFALAEGEFKIIEK
ncbi:Type 1 glutamine amidotransferase-like domain-containing protein [Candidatus Nomurabacteria bacterium]|nr:Type 1 glutamine amidotransferase-like domain-containing protein [Candidatus Nomurabacteria bacterium]